MVANPRLGSKLRSAPLPNLEATSQGINSIVQILEAMVVPEVAQLKHEDTHCGNFPAAAGVFRLATGRGL